MPNTPPNSTQYISDGLTLVSNNPSVIKRDDRGNIMLESGSTTNQPVIIEPNYNSYTNESFINIADTAFNYYKFPPTRFQSGAGIELPDLGDNLDIVQSTLEDYYTIPYDADREARGEPGPRISIPPTWNPSSWFLGPGAEGEVIAPSNGFQRVPLVGNQNKEQGAYIITPDTINLLKDTNQTLRFSIGLTFVHDTQPPLPAEAAYDIRLVRSNPSTWHPLWDGKYKLTSTGQWPSINFDYVVDLNETAEYDKFYIECFGWAQSWVMQTYAFWQISVEDDIGPYGFIDSSFVGKSNNKIWRLEDANGPEYIPLQQLFPLPIDPATQDPVPNNPNPPAGETITPSVVPGVTTSETPQTN